MKGYITCNTNVHKHQHLQKLTGARERVGTEAKLHPKRAVNIVEEREDGSSIKLVHTKFFDNDRARNPDLHELLLLCEACKEMTAVKISFMFNLKYVPKCILKLPADQRPEIVLKKQLSRAYPAIRKLILSEAFK